MASFYIALVFLALSMNIATALKCETCNTDSCVPPEGCLSGRVQDFCGCCYVCGRIEGEKCDNDTLPLPYSQTYGYCGEHLECRLREDLDPSDPLEALCVCKQNEIICASDGKTYKNTCQMMEEAHRTRQHLKAVSHGPCKSEPWIVTGPEVQAIVKGANAALSCEVMGFPIPTVEWQQTRTDGITVDLPRDDQHIAVQSRGGPEKFEVTGWLQILDFQNEDIGQFTCIARNSEGEARASASLSIKDGAKEEENEV